jgi:hypothetical protein
MLWIERLEKLGRSVLWLVLAATIVIVPIEYIKTRRAETALQDTIRKEELQRVTAEKAEKEKAERPERLPLSTVEPSLMALDGSTGKLWFTNVSNRRGFLCVVGVATNPSSKQSTESIAGCKPVTPYASNMELPVIFAGADLRFICKDATCSLSFKDAPEAK